MECPANTKNMALQEPGVDSNDSPRSERNIPLCHKAKLTTTPSMLSALFPSFSFHFMENKIAIELPFPSCPTNGELFLGGFILKGGTQCSAFYHRDLMFRKCGTVFSLAMHNLLSVIIGLLASYTSNQLQGKFPGEKFLLATAKTKRR